MRRAAPNRIRVERTVRRRMEEQRAILIRLVEGDDKHDDVAGRGVDRGSVDGSPNAELSPELMESLKELALLDPAELFETIRRDAVIDTLLPGEPSRVVDKEPDREV